MNLSRNLGDRYSPLLFLNAITAGFLAISFYLYLTIMEPMYGVSAPALLAFGSIISGGKILPLLLLMLGLAGFFFFTYQFVRLTQWNLGQFKRWEKTEAFHTFSASSSALQILCLPLTLLLGLFLFFLAFPVIVPYVRPIKEFLFPFLLLGLGIMAYRLLKFYLSGIAVSFPEEKTLTHHTPNVMSKIISTAVFGVLALNFTTISTISDVRLTILIADFGGFSFLLSALLSFCHLLSLGLRGLSEGQSPKNFIPAIALLAPVSFVLTFVFLRIFYSIPGHPEGLSVGVVFLFMFLLLCLFALMAAFGASFIKRQGYAERFLQGKEFSIGGYAIICAGLSLFALGHYLTNDCLVRLGFWDGLSWINALVFLPFVLLQFWAVRTFFKLNKLFFTPARGQTAQPPLAP